MRIFVTILFFMSASIMISQIDYHIGFMDSIHGKIGYEHQVKFNKSQIIVNDDYENPILIPQFPTIGDTALFLCNDSLQLILTRKNYSTIIVNSPFNERNPEKFKALSSGKEFFLSESFILGCEPIKSTDDNTMRGGVVYYSFDDKYDYMLLIESETKSYCILSINPKHWDFIQPNFVFKLKK